MILLLLVEATHSRRAGADGISAANKNTTHTTVVSESSIIVSTSINYRKEKKNVLYLATNRAMIEL